MRSVLIIFVCVFYTITNDQIGEASVSKCYFCPGVCSEPLQEITCSPGSSCTANGVTYDSTHRIEMKNCVTVNSSVVEACRKVNREKGSFCYLCDKDLCNSVGFNSTLGQGV